MIRGPRFLKELGIEWRNGQEADRLSPVRSEYSKTISTCSFSLTTSCINDIFNCVEAK